MRGLNMLQRLEKLESIKKATKRRSYVFCQYEDFKGPTAMQKEIKSEEYKGCVIILNDIP